MIDCISAVTFATHDMRRAVSFYRMLGFELLYGGEDAAFTSFCAGRNFLNLIAQPADRQWSWWGRVIFYDSDVDDLHVLGEHLGRVGVDALENAAPGQHFIHRAPSPIYAARSV